MATDRDGAVNSDKEKTPATRTQVTPPGTPESPWIIHSLNQIKDQIDNVEKRIQEQIKGIQKQIDGLETRLRRFERVFRMGQGILITVLVIWACIQFVASSYHISFTPKP